MMSAENNDLDDDELVSIEDVMFAVEQQKEANRIAIEESAIKHATSPVYVAEAERQLVGACLIDPKETMEIIEGVGLKPNDFYVESLRHIYTAIESLWLTKKEITVISVVDHLHRRKTLQFTGGQKSVLALQAGAVAASVSMSKANAQIILEKSKLRSIMRESGKALERCKYGEQPSDIIEELFTSLSKISIGNSSSNIANL
jgi:replicative DNA helicase